MSRRRRAEKREVLPDPKFGDLVVTKFMNYVMYEGKKAVAENIVYGAFDILENRRKDLETIGRDISKLENIKAPFPRITYDEAVAMLKEFGVASLKFMPAEQLSRTIRGMERNELCRGCTEGIYPTAEGQHQYQTQLHQILTYQP